MKFKSAVVVCFCLVLVHGIRAQWVPSAAFNAMAPQHRDWRITGQPEQGYFSILSNASFMASNTLAHPATWLAPLPGRSSPQIDLNAIFEDFDDYNAAEANATLTLFNAGFFLGEMRNTFVDFAATEHVNARIGLPSDLLRLPFTGNATFNGTDAETVDLAPLDVSLLHYRSYSASVQHKFGERLSVAARIHRLHGFHHLAIEENRWGLTTDAADWSWSVEGGGRVVSSGLNAIYQANASGQLNSLAEALPQHLASFNNKGWGMDAGIEMRWTERWSTWLQFNRGGNIRWTNDVLIYEVETFKWELDGFDVTNGGSDWIDGAAAISDSVESWAIQELAAIEAHHLASESQVAYKSKLPNRIVAGAEYTVLRGDQGGQLSLGGMIECLEQRPMSWSVAINARLGNGLQSTLTYGNRFGLVSTAGVSLGVPLGPLMLFAVAEGHQVLDWSHFSVAHGGERTEWSMPTEAPYFAAQAGLVWRLKWRKPKAVHEAEPLAPFQNSTRAPAFGFDLKREEAEPQPQPCVLPDGN